MTSTPEGSCGLENCSFRPEEARRTKNRGGWVPICGAQAITKLNIEASNKFFHRAKETEQFVTYLITSDRFRLLNGSHHQRCPDHHFLAEVNDNSRAEKETGSPKVTLLLSAVQIEMERPVVYQPA